MAKANATIELTLTREESKTLALAVRDALYSATALTGEPNEPE